MSVDLFCWKALLTPLTRSLRVCLSHAQRADCVGELVGVFCLVFAVYESA